QDNSFHGDGNRNASLSRGVLGMSRAFRTIVLGVSTGAALIFCIAALGANSSKPKFRVIAFFTGKQDQAHISFVHEAVRWFPQVAAQYNFSFDTTSDWNNLRSDFLSRYQVVVFFDTRPEDAQQRAAFQEYME